MDAIYNLEIAVVLWLQSLGTWLVGPMKFFTSLGNEQFYMLAVPLLFWCIDPGLGLRVGLGLMFSHASRYIFKLALHTPRPYWVDQRVLPLSSEPSFGAPSGHAQNAVAFWGLIVVGLKRSWAWVVAIVLILLISLSRLYLGVHFLSDVLIGWLVGIVIVWLFVRYERPVLDWLRRKPVTGQIGIVLATSLAMIVFASLARLALRGWTIPAPWIALAAKAGPFDPFMLSEVITPSATFFGMAAGAILLAQQGWMHAGGAFLQRLARFLLGIVGVMVIWYGLDRVFPSGEAFVPYVFRFVRYALVGFWMAYLAPLIFFRLRLAAPKYALPAAPAAQPS